MCPTIRFLPFFMGRPQLTKFEVDHMIALGIMLQKTRNQKQMDRRTGCLTTCIISIYPIIFCFFVFLGDKK